MTRVVVDRSAVEAFVQDDPGVHALVGRMLGAGADAARRYVPVDSGALQADITVDHDGSEGAYGNNLDYSEYVEFGTSDTPAQPYLRPSVDAMKGAV